MKYKLRIIVSTTNFLKLNPKHELISLIYAEHEIKWINFHWSLFVNIKFRMLNNYSINSFKAYVIIN